MNLHAASTITPRHRWRISDLRRLPIRESDRLEILSYDLTHHTANGSRTYSFAPCLLDECLAVEAQITRDSDGFWIELPDIAFDSAKGVSVAVEYPPSLLSTFCHRLESCHLLAKAQAYGRREGRN